MFAEEEWAEAPPAGEQSPPVGNAKSSGKSRVINKRRLKQTLQTLGSVPVWDSAKSFEDSDEAMEEGPVHVNKPKKKCKKRKKVFDEEGEREQNGAEKRVRRLTQNQRGEGENHVKRPRPKRNQRGEGLDTSVESAKDKDKKGQKQKDSRCPEDATEKKLSRQQWRNKMKNKKRSKNKFHHNSAEVAKINTEGGEVTEVLPKAEKTQSHDLSPRGERCGQKKSTGALVSTNAAKNNKATAEKESKSIKCIKPTVEKFVDEGARTGSTAAHPHPQPCEKQQPVKRKIHSLQEKKLRHILNAHVAASSEKLVGEKGETLNADNEEVKCTLDRSSALRSRMEKRLESARFRYINELLYTSTSGEAKRMFKQDPDAIQIYHKGYVAQVKHWPANPVDLIISYIRQKPSSLVVADFGCGDCKIARSVKNKVHCFDLAPVCDLVTPCDMARVPLEDSTVDIAVFCLSLMGTNLSDFLAEANRVLQMGGFLKIAEVASRFDNTRQFIGALSHLGFKLVSKDTDNSHFYSFEFVKVQNPPGHVKKTGLQLKPCLYKKR
ncbi:uncharacterized protein rrp8 [Brachyhypopomus gauderio]|uniref:uncharacterized protein rrp8 n=1 Tax=Brachyhypopomus gauderio TaxID=698409 RepID=UPI00404124A4